MSFSLTQVALEVGAYLYSRKSLAPTTTTRIMGSLKTTDNRTRLLKVLRHLQSKAIVVSHGSGKLAWKWITAVSASETVDSIITHAMKDLDSPLAKGKKTSEGSSDFVKDLALQVQNLQAEVKALKESGLSSGPRTIEIKVNDVTLSEIEEKVPPYFKDILALAAQGINIMLVGPAGCGKTTVAALIAKALGRGFKSTSASGGMNESQLLGRSTPNLSEGTQVYKESDFVHAFENGEVFLLDEMDGADPNLLLCLNSALANGYISLPNRPGEMAKMHPNFVMIASANTFGKGANRIYAGRNQLDEATLDRFRMGTIECQYDREVEASLCPHSDLLLMVWGIRQKVEEMGLRRIVSTRFLKDAAKMKACGWTNEKIIGQLVAGWSEDEKKKVGVK